MSTVFLFLSMGFSFPKSSLLFAVQQGRGESLFDSLPEKELFDKLSADYISGITFSGGDPLHKRNREEITRLAKKVREILPEKTIWLYTGYNWEDIQDLEIIPLLDVLVDGQYVEAVRDPKLHWKGSANQRVIDVQETLKLGKLVLFD